MLSAQQAYQQGMEAERTGDVLRAEQCYREALAHDEEFTVARFRLANLLCDQGHRQEALTCYLLARRQRPDVASIHNNLGTLYKEQGDFENAYRCFQEAVRRDPHSLEAWNNLGTIHQWHGDFDQAELCFQEVLKREPRFPGASINLGNVKLCRGDFEAALRCFDNALTISPQSREARFNRSLALIQFEHFEQGWQEYESRFGHKVEPRNISIPRWNPHHHKCETLLVYGEQGVGDEIMFGSCLMEATQACRTCFWECDPRLVALFSRSFPAINVLPRPCDHLLSRPAILPAIHAQISAGSLPMFFRRKMEDFPRHTGYLIPNAQLLEKWRDRYRQLPAGLKVGIAWQGGREPELQQQRSIPLDIWRPVFSLNGLQFINLQYGDCTKGLQTIRETIGMTIHDWDDSDPLTDLDDFAAKIFALDLVISVDNSTVHLAGGLGVPVWTLLAFTADFRWLTGRTQSPWYPSMRLFRQPKPWDWSAVMEQVTQELHRGFHCVSNRVA
ncbi:MAG: tetratricopeptide repeat protein [Planctomycetaceae bacterium]